MIECLHGFIFFKVLEQLPPAAVYLGGALILCLAFAEVKVYQKTIGSKAAKGGS